MTAMAFMDEATLPSAQWEIRDIPCFSTRYTLCKSQGNITTLGAGKRS
jgi:hypothetical protein